jgi:hypothetical protein
MISVLEGWRRRRADSNGNAESMGGRDKPGHDGPRDIESSTQLHPIGPSDLRRR